MFAIYSYVAGATQANILADVVAILTGETNKANLSAGCDQAVTNIYNAYTNATWTVHDAAPATNARILKQLCADGVYYKYLGIDLNTAGQIKLGGAETWNEVAHTGTNMCGTTGTTNAFAAKTLNEFFSPSTTAGSILIYSDAAITFMKTFRGTSYGTLMGMVVEHTRQGFTQNVANGYPCWSVDKWKPRVKSYNGAGDATGTSTIGCCMVNPHVFYSPQNGRSGPPFGRVTIRGIDEVAYYRLLPFTMCAVAAGISAAAQGDILGEIYGGINSDSYIGDGLGSILDETTFNSKTYINIGSEQLNSISANSFTFLVMNCSGGVGGSNYPSNFFVPKG